MNEMVKVNNHYPESCGSIAAECMVRRTRIEARSCLYLRIKAFTLVELLVVISIISILAGLLLPALQNAYNSARKLSCVSQEKQMCMGNAMYISDFDDWTLTTYRYNRFWFQVLAKDYGMGEALFHCPAEPNYAYDSKKINYGLNILTFGETPGGAKKLEPQKASKIQRFNRSTRLIVFIDTPPVYSDLHSIRNSSGNASYWEATAHIAGINSTSSDWYPSYARHDGDMGVALFDGHVETLKGEDLLFLREDYCNPCMKAWTDGQLAIRTFTPY